MDATAVTTGGRAVLLISAAGTVANAWTAAGVAATRDVVVGVGTAAVARTTAG